MSGVRPVVQRRHVDGVALITIDNPPVNALSHAVRAGLWEAVEASESDASIHALVIEGAADCFVAGADLRELDAPPRAPTLSSVLDRLESCRKPVIAAVEGLALGGGLELALACHLRVATAGARFGLPEVKLGLLPGAGGTARLPRLVGAARALEMMLGGEPVDVDAAPALIDSVVPKTCATAEAIRLAKRLHQPGETCATSAESRNPLAPRRTLELPPPALLSDAEEHAALQRHARALRGTESGALIVQCLRAAAEKPAAEALQAARSAFATCRESGASRALRHLFFAERAVGRVAGVSGPVTRLAVIGAGTMGVGIAITLAEARLPTAVIDVDDAALGRGEARFRSHFRTQVERGRLMARDAEERLGFVTFHRGIAAIDEADVVIEAAIEDLETKRRIFAELDARLPPTAVLATNTSYLDVDQIATATGRADRVLGLHFFSPAHVMKLVEVVRAASTSNDTLATGVALARRLRKLPVVVGNGTGFVGNRMLQVYGRESQFLLLEGATPLQVDQALETFGMAMGPCTVYDLAGLDVGWRARRQRPDRPDDPQWFRVADALVEAGRLGQKSGAGHYRYDTPNRRTDDPHVHALIEAEATRLGVHRRTITDVEIVERCLLALVAEGRALVDSGVARCAADIDVVWVNGYGFPRWRGGPMHWAGQIGWAEIETRLAALARERGAAYWSPGHRVASPPRPSP